MQQINLNPFSSPSQTYTVQQREKTQAHLFYEYNEAIKLLKTKKFEQGILNLQKILSSPIITETQLRKLKKSVILSLANIMLIQKKLHQAFFYFFQALEIQRQIIRDEEQVFDPNTTNSSEYSLLMKMFGLTQSLGYHQHSIFLLKNALLVSPSLWEQNILEKLQTQYKQLEMYKELTDLQKLRMNKTLLKSIIQQQQTKITQKCKQSKNQASIQNQIIDPISEEEENTEQQQILKNLRIQIQKQSQTYSSIQYLLTTCYVLLKCQKKRNFNRKRYLHKKYESSNVQWNHFLSEFSTTKTAIQLVIQPIKNHSELNQKKKDPIAQNKGDREESVSQVEEANQMIDEKNTNEGMIEKLTAELLRINYTKKKKNKPKNTTTEIEAPVLPTKFANKKYHVQQKIIYDSLNHYFNENLQKTQLTKDQIMWMQDFFPQSFNQHLQKIVRKPQDDENQAQPESQLLNIPKTLKPTDKEPDQPKAKSNQTEKKLNAKDKKELEMKKIQYQNSLLQDFFKNQTQNSYQKNQSQEPQARLSRLTVRFSNVCELIQCLISWILQQQIPDNQEVQNDFSLLKTNNIRKLLVKNILKIIPDSKCFLKQLLPKSSKKLSLKSFFLLDILVQHFDFMSFKKPKNTEFTPHQNNKITWLSSFIEDEFQIDSRLICGKSSKQLGECCLIAMWSKSMIKFFTTKNKFDQEMIGFYKQICQYSNKRANNLISEAKQKVENFFQAFIRQTTQRKIETLIQERTQNLINSDESQLQVTVPLPASNKQLDIDSLLSMLQANQPLTEEKQVFQKIVYLIGKYFEKLQEESESKEEFSVKQMQAMTQKYKMQELVNKLYNKFRNPQSGIIKNFEASTGYRQNVLILLIKLCLMGSLNSNDDCLRILFYLTNIYLKERKERIQNINQDGKQAISKQKDEIKSLVNKIIVLYRNMIEFSEKKQKLESVSMVLRKFYQNIITKNLPVIYNGTKEQWKQKQQKRQQINKQVKHQFRKLILDYQLEDHSLLDIVKFLSNSEEKSQYLPVTQPPVQGQDIILSQTLEFLNHMQLQDQIMDIINGLYYGPESEFAPKKLQDAVGYFLFLSRNHSDEFESEELQLTNTVVKVFKKCYLVFADKKTELAKYCDRYKDVLSKVDKYWDGNEKQNNELIQILRANAEPCTCCAADKILPNFDYSEIVYILAKFFQSNAFLEENDENTSKKSSLEFTQLDQEYYKEYLMFNRKNPGAWINYIRVHCLKAYLYFDSLVSVQSIQTFKNKFLFTKRIINFVKLQILEPLDQNHSQLPTSLQTLKEFSIRTLNVLNILKVKQRQFFMHLKQLEIHNDDKKEIKEAKKKYLEGLKTIREKYDSLDNITSIYLGTVELSIPEISFAELNRETFDKISLLGRKVKETIMSLERFEKDEHSVHLEEDLVVQFYIVVAKLMQNVVEKILKSQKPKSPTSELDSQNLSVCNSFVSYWLNPTNQVCKQSKYLLHFRSSDENQLLMVSQERQVINIDDNDLSDQDPSVSEIIEEANNQVQKQIVANKVFNFKPLESKHMLEEKNQDLPLKNSEVATPNAQKKHKKTQIYQLDIKEYTLRKINQQSLRQPLTYQEEQILRKISTFLNALSNLFKSLPRHQSKRYKYRRSITTSLLYISQLYLKYFNEPSVSFEVIKDYFNIRSDDIVFIFTYSDRKSTQKNVVLSEFYNRAIIHNLQRIRFIKHLIDCYEKSQNIESLIVLIRKLNKIMVSGGEEQNKEIKYLLMLYWYAVDAYVNLVQKFAVNKPIEERYEKILIELKNRIKRSIQSKFEPAKTDQKAVQPDSKIVPGQTTANQNIIKESKQKALKENYYFQRIDKFIKNYEQRYERKVKLKKSKKQRELEKQLKEKGGLIRNEQPLENQIDEKNSPMAEVEKLQENDELAEKKISPKINYSNDSRLIKPKSPLFRALQESKSLLDQSVGIIKSQVEVFDPHEEAPFANQFQFEDQDIGHEGLSGQEVPQVAKSKKEKLKQKKDIKHKEKQVVNLDSDQDEQNIHKHINLGETQKKAKQVSKDNESDFLRAVKQSIEQLIPIKSSANTKMNRKDFIVIEDDQDEEQQDVLEKPQFLPKKQHKPE